MKNKQLPDIHGSAAQMEAIRHVNGPAMVLAGPGSGKTFVIIHRIQYLIEESDIDPSSILVITFTKAAALEMQQRFLKLTDSEFPEVHFGTFHSCFYQILRSSGFKGDIIGESYKYKLLEKILQDIPGQNDDDISSENIKTLLSEISRIKNSGKEASEHLENIPFSDSFNNIFSEYSKMLRNLQKIDFDDMILECYSFLKKYPRELEKWQNNFKYILIDEFQDINDMQFKVINMLAARYRNLFIVGDDDQSIYHFRGSKPELMLGFDHYYPDVKKIFLNTNYRCGKKIVSLSLLSINENKSRFYKDIISGNSNEGNVVLKNYTTRDEEYKSMVSFLQKRDDLNEIAVIFRTNSEIEVFSLYLKEYGILHVTNSAQKKYWDRPYIIDILSYLDFANAGEKRSDYYRIMNKPLRYFSRDSAPDEKISHASLTAYYKNKKSMLFEVDKFYREIKMLKSLRPYLSIKFIRNAIGYEKFILYKKSDDEISRIKADLDNLERIAMRFQDYKSFRREVFRLCEEERDENSRDNKSSKEGVRLITMHASKGLEFKTVWLPDLNEGIVPGRQATLTEEIEEERRMFYVGMTRAKENLIMSYVTGSGSNQMMASRFLRPFKKRK
ncbi:MAG: ATP-dependent helicase [Butyrivibrio sp.]|nr:ATP-dependent helicase [Butyrivibrio sp.]